MKNTIFFLLLFLACSFLGNSQSEQHLNDSSFLQQSLDSLTSIYYGIRFNERQTKKLSGKNLELTYFVDTFGLIELRHIKGIKDESISDSLSAKAKSFRIPPFDINRSHMARSMYVCYISFPRRYIKDGRYTFEDVIEYETAHSESFEYLVKSNKRLDFDFTAISRQYFGNAANHLGLGIGLKIDLMFTTKNALSFGYNIGFVASKLKDEYPLDNVRAQEDFPAPLMMGLNVGRWMKLNNNNPLHIQLELNYISIDITEDQPELDPGILQINGFSPGIALKWPINLEKDFPKFFEGQPAIFFNNVNISFASRYLITDKSYGNGLALELGIGFNFGVNYAKDYKLKK